MSATPLYQIFGIDEAPLKIAGDRDRVRGNEEILNDRSHWQWGEIRGRLVFDYFLLGCVAYLRGETTLAENSFLKAISYCKDHFFGEWRSTHAIERSKGDPDFWRGRACLERFSEAVVACAAVGDWSSAAELARYPDERCRNPRYEGADEELNLALALADWLKHGELTPGGSEHLQKARQGKAARPREEAKLLETAAGKDEGTMVATFQAFMKFYKARVFPARDLTDKQSKAGTFWYHWFKKEGVDLDPDGKWSNYLIRLPATKVLA
jgi:hypothetical protein